MQLKWFEDLVALGQTGSFSRAAQLRHVTHPAFGRRIKALEEWAGVALVVRGSAPVRLTAAGESLLHDSQHLVQGINQARESLQGAAGGAGQTVRLATGRTLARTLVADWLTRLQPLLAPGQAQFQIITRSLTVTAQLLERGEVDFTLTYHHPLLASNLNARRYSYLTMAQDRLVPVTRRDATGRLAHAFGGTAPVPYLAYAPTLALERLVTEHLANHPQLPALQPVVVCDSVDALYEYALKGLGVAWLPWSMVAADSREGRLAVLGNDRLAVQFEVRLYRAKRRLAPLVERVWEQATPLD